MLVEVVPNLSLAIDLGRLTLAFGRVNRATFHGDGRTPESDTDHTVMLGLIACTFAPTELNPGRIAEYALVHDLVEAMMEGGDINSFDISPENQARKEAIEASALKDLRREFSTATWMLERIDEYEEQEAPESRWVRYIDKALPKITHTLNGCATPRDMGKTRDDLIRAHSEQLEKLNKQYPEFAGWGGSILHGLMKISEREYAEGWQPDTDCLKCGGTGLVNRAGSHASSCGCRIGDRRLERIGASANIP